MFAGEGQEIPALISEKMVFGKEFSHWRPVYSMALFNGFKKTFSEISHFYLDKKTI